MVLDDEIRKLIILRTSQGVSSRNLGRELGIGKSTIGDFLREETHNNWWAERNDKVLKGKMKGQHVGAKILSLDIETAPIKAWVWQMFDNNLGLNMIDQDWYILSWSAKWMHEDEVMYQDKSDSWDDEDDRELLEGIHALLDEADIIITQNGKRFDDKKLRARFILSGMKPPSSYRHIDTCQEAKKHFGFTSNKLEYMTDKLCKKYKKLKHGKFPGFELWAACLQGNSEAWDEMEEYNIHDTLSMEELYTIMRPWMKTHFNMNLYHNDNTIRCKCGCTDFEHNGYSYTNLSKFDRFQCSSCGAEIRGRVNLLSKEKRATLRMNVIG